MIVPINLASIAALALSLLAAGPVTAQAQSAQRLPELLDLLNDPAAAELEPLQGPPEVFVGRRLDEPVGDLAAGDFLVIGADGNGRIGTLSIATIFAQPAPPGTQTCAQRNVARYPSVYNGGSATTHLYYCRIGDREVLQEKDETTSGGNQQTTPIFFLDCDDPQDDSLLQSQLTARNYFKVCR